MTPEIEAQVRELVAASMSPLDAGALRRALKLKAKLKDAFAHWLAGRGFVEWPPATAKGGPRYWTRSDEDVAEEIALAAAVTPLDPKKLLTAISKGKSGYPKDRGSALLAKLEDEGKLHRQPLLAETKYKLTSRLTEESREFLHRALRVVLRSLKALGESPVTVAEEKPEAGPDARILELLAQLEPQKGLLVTASRLRRAAIGISKEQFDDAVMRLYRSEQVLLHRHSGPFLLPADERNELIQ